MKERLQGSWWDDSEKAFYHVVLGTDGHRLRVFATSCSTLLTPQVGEDNTEWMQGDELHANGLYIRKIRIRLDENTGEAIRKIYQLQAWSTPSRLKLISSEEEAARGKYLSLNSVWRALETRDTVLVKGSWLIKWAEQGKVPPRRQELPRGAIWETRELKRLVEKYEVFLMALSYCWVKSGIHPDPNGEQLRTLAAILKHRFAVKYKDGSSVFTDAGIFLDWCSLYQEGPHGERRTEEEQDSFGRAFENTSLWYAHEGIETWLLTRAPEGVINFDLRGWTTFETAIGSMITPDHMLLDIGKFVQGRHHNWPEIYAACKAGRNPPKTPERFNPELARKSFDVCQDVAKLQQAYTETFENVLQNVLELAFSNLDWIDEEALLLSASLPQCTSVEKIDLKSNDIGAEGVAAIFEAAAQCPQLQVISMTKNPLGNAGAQAISIAIPNIPSLKTLWLNECNIGDDGIESLMRYLRHCTSLDNFYVFDNNIKDEGAVAIIDALPQCPSLVQFGIGGNDISEPNIQRLQEAWYSVERQEGNCIYVR